MTEQAERFRRRMGIAVFGVAFAFVAILTSSLVGYGEDGGNLATTILLEFFVSLLAVGFGLIVIDPPLSRIMRAAEEQEKRQRRETEEQLQEERYLAELEDRLSSRVAGVAARASEELQRRGWFRKSKLTGVNFSGANLSGASLMGLQMRECQAVGTNFSLADIRDADFTEGDFRRATFAGSDLTSTIFRDADLTGVNFEDAFLDGVDFSDADLHGAKLTGAHLTGANIGWDGTEEGFESDGGIVYSPAKFNERTVLPDGKTWTPETDMTRYTGVTTLDQ